MVKMYDIYMNKCRDFCKTKVEEHLVYTYYKKRNKKAGMCYCYSMESLDRKTIKSKGRNKNYKTCKGDGADSEKVTKACKFQNGDGTGGTEINTHKAVRNPAECVNICVIMKEKDPFINGASLSATGNGACWCEKGMTGRNNVKTWQSCMMKDDECIKGRPRKGIPLAVIPFHMVNISDIYMNRCREFCKTKVEEHLVYTYKKQNKKAGMCYCYSMESLDRKTMRSKGRNKNYKTCEVDGADSEKVTKACGDPNRSGTSGNITSPNFPNNYGDNERCVWIITVNNDKNVEVTIEELDIQKGPEEENKDDCEYDDLKITDGSSDDDYLLGKYCGENIANISVRSSGNKVRLEFKADERYTYKGFKLEWKAIPDLFEAIKNDKVEIFRNTITTHPSRLLDDFKYEQTLYQYAICIYKPQILEVLEVLLKGSNGNMNDRLKSYGFKFALICKHTEYLRILLKSGVDVESKVIPAEEGYGGYTYGRLTPLHYALNEQAWCMMRYDEKKWESDRCYAKFVKELRVKYNASVDATDLNENTALHYAASLCCYFCVVKLVNTFHARVDVKNKDQQRPIDIHCKPEGPFFKGYRTHLYRFLEKAQRNQRSME